VRAARQRPPVWVRVEGRLKVLTLAARGEGGRRGGGGMLGKSALAVLVGLDRKIDPRRRASTTALTGRPCRRWSRRADSRSTSSVPGERERGIRTSTRDNRLRRETHDLALLDRDGTALHCDLQPRLGVRQQLIVLDFELAAGTRLEGAVSLLVDPLAERLVVPLVVDNLRERREQARLSVDCGQPRRGREGKIADVFEPRWRAVAVLAAALGRQIEDAWRGRESRQWDQRGVAHRS